MDRDSPRARRLVGGQRSRPRVRSPLNRKALGRQAGRRGARTSYVAAIDGVSRHRAAE